MSHVYAQVGEPLIEGFDLAEHWDQLCDLDQLVGYLLDAYSVDIRPAIDLFAE